MRTRTLLVSLALVATIAACSKNSGNDGGTASPTPIANPLWAEDIAPILYDNCGGCHRPDSIAPFSLLTYGSAAALSQSIKAATGARRMPPSPVDVSGDCNTYSDARYLTDVQIQTLANWVDTGAPQGNPANAPALPTPVPTLANVTHTVDIGGPWTPPPGTDSFRCFVADPGIVSSTYVTGFDVIPGAPAVVHHVLLFAVSDPTDQATAIALDNSSAGLGFDCYGDSGIPNAPVVGAWAPGTGATVFPGGTGVSIDAGTKFIMQIHYNTVASAAVPDQTQMELATNVTALPALIAGIIDTDFNIPPGSTDYSHSKTFTAPQGGRLWGVFPHMHKLGTRMTLETVHADGTTTCMSDVPRWNFNWQGFHNFTTPLTIHAGDDIRITCHWNSTGVTQPTVFGETTEDEMCIFGFYASP